jgi:hypothetical protein
MQYMEWMDRGPSYFKFPKQFQSGVVEHLEIWSAIIGHENVQIIGHENVRMKPRKSGTYLRKPKGVPVFKGRRGCGRGGRAQTTHSTQIPY